jgi:tetraprenyl-beta-curcumene synthase
MTAVPDAEPLRSRIVAERVFGPRPRSDTDADSETAAASESADLAIWRAFATTVATYLLRVMPEVRREVAYWQSATEAIGDETLRATARRALAKRGNIEGAALFATLAPGANRSRTVRALVAYQSAYNYLDALSELPSSDPVANADQLHQALLTALHPDAAHVDYYMHNPQRRDGGYLTAMLDVCRRSLGSLPSFPALAPTVRLAAARIVDFQTLNLAEADGGHDALERWAFEAALAASHPPAWWETAAAAGSSLAVHALIAAAADPNLGIDEARAIDGAYWPWAGGLHSLLDSLVDREEDEAGGRTCLLDYYTSGAQAALRLGVLAREAVAATDSLPGRDRHRLILTAMCSYYLSAPENDTAEALMITESLTNVLGRPLIVAIALFRAKRYLHNSTHHLYR